MSWIHHSWALNPLLEWHGCGMVLRVAWVWVWVAVTTDTPSLEISKITHTSDLSLRGGGKKPAQAWPKPGPPPESRWLSAPKDKHILLSVSVKWSSEMQSWCLLPLDPNIPHPYPKKTSTPLLSDNRQVIKSGPSQPSFTASLPGLNCAGRTNTGDHAIHLYQAVGRK